MSDFFAVVVAAAISAVAFLVQSVLTVAILTLIASYAFGFAWTWQLALVVWAVCLLAKWVFNSGDAE